MASKLAKKWYLAELFKELKKGEDLTNYTFAYTATTTVASAAMSNLCSILNMRRATVAPRRLMTAKRQTTTRVGIIASL